MVQIINTEYPYIRVGHLGTPECCYEQYILRYLFRQISCHHPIIQFVMYIFVLYHVLGQKQLKFFGPVEIEKGVWGAQMGLIDRDLTLLVSYYQIFSDHSTHVVYRVSIIEVNIILL